MKVILTMDITVSRKDVAVLRQAGAGEVVATALGQGAKIKIEFGPDVKAKEVAKQAKEKAQQEKETAEKQKSEEEGAEGSQGQGTTQ